MNLRTRAGSEVKMYEAHASGTRPMVGAYLAGDDWIPVSWLADGRFSESRFTSLDLVTADAEPGAA